MTTTDLTEVFTNTGLNGDSGSVNLSLNTGAWIYGSGAGGVVILAQSVGGGLSGLRALRSSPQP